MSCLFNRYKPHYFAGRGLYEGSHAVGHTGISPGIPRRSFDGDLDGWMVQVRALSRPGKVSHIELGKPSMESISSEMHTAHIQKLCLLKDFHEVVRSHGYNLPPSVSQKQ